MSAQKTASTKKVPRFFASAYPGTGHPLSDRLGDPLKRLGASLGMPVWLLLQDGPHSESEPFVHLDDQVTDAFRERKDQLPTGEPIALVINSPGGMARDAYQIARFLRRRCGGFVAVVPDSAWSAATLLTLGADQIYLGPDASLGPIDAQLYDREKETFGSALNEVQALQRLQAYALESIDATMWLLYGRTGKTMESLLPRVLHFVAESMRPLLEQIDVVHYNERARILKVAEEYAVRLLGGDSSDASFHPGMSPHANRLASQLVERYPEHGFPIDFDEAQRLGLPVVPLNAEMGSLLEELWQPVRGVTAIGQLVEGD